VEISGKTGYMRVKGKSKRNFSWEREMHITEVESKGVNQKVGHVGNSNDKKRT